MANPTVNSGITQAANLRAALWVSPDVDQSGTPTKGAWDAQNSEFWPVHGTSTDLTSVACGTSGINGLSCIANVDSGIYVQSSGNLTGTLWETYGNGPFSFVALVKREGAGALSIFNNRDGWSPNEGYLFYIDSDGSINGFHKGSGTNCGANSSASQIAVGEVAVLGFTFDPSGTPTFKIYKNGTQIATNTGSYTATAWGASERRAGFFDADARTGSGHQTGTGAVYAGLFYSTVLSAAELQTFGTSEAEALAGDFYAAAFDGLTGGGGGSAVGAAAHYYRQLQG